MKVCLINPPPKEVKEIYEQKGFFPHIGLAYLGSYLEQKNVDYSILDCKFEGIDITELKERLLKINPNVVGLTAMTHEIENAAFCAKEIKKILPQTKIIIGGTHSTILPEETMSMYKEFDILIYGEGEHTLYETVMAIKNNNNLKIIKGIVFRDKDKIVKNEPRPFIENLDELPFPAWHKFSKSKKYPVLASRGCPFRCVFCTRLSGNKIRNRTVENVVSEFEHIVKNYHTELIMFYDETFTLNKERVIKLTDMLIEKKLNDTKWSVQTRVNVVDYDMLVRMKKAGCVEVGFGVESGNEQILKVIKKDITKEQVIKAVESAKKAGLRTESYFIIGHPFETIDTINDTINFAVKLNTSTVAFGIMVPYPGTEVYEMAKQNIGGYKMIASNWNDFNKQIGNALEIKGLDRKTLEKMQYLGYLKFYVYNLKLYSFIKFIFTYRKMILAILRKHLPIKDIYNVDRKDFT